MNPSTVDSSSEDTDLNRIEQGHSEKTKYEKINYKEFYEHVKKTATETDRQKILIIEQLIEAQRAQEEEFRRQKVLTEQLHRQFRVVGDTFHFKDQPGAVAFKDKGERVVTTSQEDRVTQAMVTMAEVKGWNTIKVSGHAEFQQKIWMEANLRGIEVQGYKPTEQDQKHLEERRDRQMQNSIQTLSDGATQHQQKVGPETVIKTTTVPAMSSQTQNPVETSQPAVQTGAAQKDPSFLKTEQREALKIHTGRVLDHGEAPYAHDPEKSMNYFVKLAMDKGTKDVWGVDLKRVMLEGKVSVGDSVTLKYMGSKDVLVKVPIKDETGKQVGEETIETVRNSWDVSIHRKAHVVEAVASNLIEANVKDPAQRAALNEAIHARTMEREKTNDVPTIHVYDKQAPTPSPSQDRTHPVPEQERDVERTR